MIGAGCIGAAAEELEPKADDVPSEAVGAPAPEETVPETAAPLLYGDANGDGEVNINDATHGQKYIAEIITEDELNFDAADVDFDGDVTIQDVSIIQKYLAEFISAFDIPKLLTLSPGSLRLEVGESVALTTSYTAEDGAVSFSANDPNVATVDENGVVTAVGTGNAIISAKADKKQSAYCTVRVIRPATAVMLNKTRLLLQASEGFTLEPSVPEGETSEEFSFVSSNSGVASVDENGVITALQDGTTTVTVTAESGVAASCEVAVMSAAPTAISVNQPTLQLGLGEVYPLKAYYNGGIPAFDAAFASDNSAVAAVDPETGSITALAEGYATVTVSSPNGKQAKCYLTVKSAPTAISFTNSAVTMLVGESVPFTLSAASRNEALGSASYGSSDSSFCTVSDSGVVTAVGAGSAVITATAYNGLTAETVVSVLAAAGTESKTTTVATAMLEDAAWKSPVIKLLPAKSTVRVIGSAFDGRWLKVQHGESCGWIYNKAVGVKKNYTSVNLNTLPAVADDLIFDRCENGVPSVKKLYDYCQYTLSYRSTAPSNTIEEQAVFAFAHLYGACYHRASALFYLLERSGYEVIYVKGNDIWTGGGPHRWCLVKTENGWRHIDPTAVRGLPEYYLVKDSALAYFSWDRTIYPAAI